MTQRPLLIATGNEGKWKEIQAALADTPWTCLRLGEVADHMAGVTVDETAVTFEGNALIKAMITAHRVGLLTLADDAGLEIDALAGRPGVRSARYAPGTDVDRYRKVLGELEAVPDSERGAQFRSVIAIYDPMTHSVRTCQGIYRGLILREPRGDYGFGYDPIFYDVEVGKTAAEMTVAEKNRVSHRGQALRLARSILMETFLA